MNLVFNALIIASLLVADNVNIFCQSLPLNGITRSRKLSGGKDLGLVLLPQHLSDDRHDVSSLDTPPSRSTVLVLPYDADTPCDHGPQRDSNRRKQHVPRATSVSFVIPIEYGTPTPVPNPKPIPTPTLKTVQPIINTTPVVYTTPIIHTTPTSHTTTETTTHTSTTTHTTTAIKYTTLQAPPPAPVTVVATQPAPPPAVVTVTQPPPITTTVASIGASTSPDFATVSFDNPLIGASVQLASPHWAIWVSVLVMFFSLL